VHLSPSNVEWVKKSHLVAEIGGCCQEVETYVTGLDNE